jgi:hypothetical protein
VPGKKPSDARPDSPSKCLVLWLKHDKSLQALLSAASSPDDLKRPSVQNSKNLRTTTVFHRIIQVKTIPITKARIRTLRLFVFAPALKMRINTPTQTIAVNRASAPDELFMVLASKNLVADVLRLTAYRHSEEPRRDERYRETQPPQIASAVKVEVDTQEHEPNDDCDREDESHLTLPLGPFLVPFG